MMHTRTLTRRETAFPRELLSVYMGAAGALISTFYVPTLLGPALGALVWLATLAHFARVWPHLRQH